LILKLKVCSKLKLVPFDEEDKDKDVWFFDHEYLENMYGMFKKVNGNCLCEIFIFKRHRFLINIK
jgi:hypothetical protein